MDSYVLGSSTNGYRQRHPIESTSTPICKEATIPCLFCLFVLNVLFVLSSWAGTISIVWHTFGVILSFVGNEQTNKPNTPCLHFFSDAFVQIRVPYDEVVVVILLSKPTQQPTSKQALRANKLQDASTFVSGSHRWRRILTNAKSKLLPVVLVILLQLASIKISKGLTSYVESKNHFCSS